MEAKDDNDRSLLLTGRLVNAAFFTLLGTGEIHRLPLSRWEMADAISWFYILLAGAYLLFAFFNKRKGRPREIVFNVSVACALVGLAIFERVEAEAVGFFLITEMLFLFVLGIYYQERIYRLLASVMSIVIVIRLLVYDQGIDQVYHLIWAVRHHVLVFSFAAVCFYVMGTLAGQTALNQDWGSDEREWYKRSYPVLATALAVYVLSEVLEGGWLSLGWGMLGAVLLLAGFKFQNRIDRLCALWVLSWPRSGWSFTI